jgi:tRNA (guanine26-N2/guanine27-N2)-dimethyltransferase
VYNASQQLNRDLSICVVNTFLTNYRNEIAERDAGRPLPHADKPKQRVQILQALAGSGLSSIRYAKEVKGFDKIVANDHSKDAVEMMRKNVGVNDVKGKIEIKHEDSMTLMYTSTTPGKKFAVIDLHGAPNHYLDAAIQSVEYGGLLLITATDIEVLLGMPPESCIVKYDTTPIPSKACHETALRVLLRFIESTANRYCRYIEPVLSLLVDCYARIFVRVYSGQQQCKESSTKQSMVFQCTGCGALTLQPLAIKVTNPDNPRSAKFVLPEGPFVAANCEHCNYVHHVGGPIWSDPIHDFDFVKQLLAYLKTDGTVYGTSDRLLDILKIVNEELPDVPLFYKIDTMCQKIIKASTIPIIKFRSAILHEGYRVSCSHTCKTSIKTDAPMSLLWDILRYWVEICPAKAARCTEGSVLNAILSKKPDKKYEFDLLHQDTIPPSLKGDCSNVKM